MLPLPTLNFVTFNPQSQSLTPFIQSHPAGPPSLLLLVQLVTNFSSFTDLSKMPQIVADVRSLDERLKKADRDATMYNGREGLLGVPISDYSQVKKIIDQFDPFLQFWSTASSWKVGEGGGGGKAAGGEGEGAQ